MTLNFNLRAALTCGLIILLVACGGGGGAAPSSSYVGNWYLAEADRYIVIDSNNVATVRKCSSVGYKITDPGSGIVSGNIVTFASGSFPLVRTGNTLLVDGSTLSLREQVPNVCTGDYIEVTAVTPTSAVAGSPSLFTVQFNYQLSTKSTGIIEVGFNTDTANSLVIDTHSLAINQGSGSGSLEATITPVLYRAPDQFKAFVLLSETPKADIWTPLDEDSLPITVTAPVMPMMAISPPASISVGTFCHHSFLNKNCNLNLKQ